MRLNYIGASAATPSICRTLTNSRARKRSPGSARCRSMSVWNNVVLRLLFFLLLICASAACASDGADAPPLLLTAKRLHRLKLDAGRHTERWVNFEQRVKTVADSPERGFELALYSAVTGDAEACGSAVEWGKTHSAEHRQIALVVNWCKNEITPADRSQLLNTGIENDKLHPFRAARDALFIDVVEGRASRDSIRRQWSQLLPLIQADPRSCLGSIYELFEFLDVAQKNFRLDLRQDDVRLFSTLPNIFLLSIKPSVLERPDWKLRAGGLMMVNVDPNLQGASFVQGWAMEDPKMAREGPGVAYELLWANPYLPGLGYYNMSLFAYDPGSSLLLARKSWDPDSCWISIFKGHADLLQCPAGMLDSPTTFGTLSLVPVKEQCMQVKPSINTVTILSGLEPGGGVVWEEQGKKFTATADSGGNLMVSSTASGRLCRASGKR